MTTAVMHGVRHDWVRKVLE